MSVVSRLSKRLTGARSLRSKTLLCSQEICRVQHKWLKDRLRYGGNPLIIGKDVQHLYDGNVDRPIRLLLIYLGLEERQKPWRYFQQGEFYGYNYHNGIHTIHGTGIQLMVAQYTPLVDLSRRQFQGLYARLNLNTEYPTTSVLYYHVIMPPVTVSAYPLKGQAMSQTMQLAHSYHPCMTGPLKLTVQEISFNNDGFRVEQAELKTIS